MSAIEKALPFVFTAAALCKDEIKTGLAYMIEQVVKRICTRITCTTDKNPKLTRAILETLKTHCIASCKSLNIHDGPGGNSQPIYELAYGDYSFIYINENTKQKKTIYVQYCKESIELRTYFSDIKFLTDFANQINSKYTINEKITLSYTIDGSKWSYPIYRRPCNIKNVNITTDMQLVLDAVDIFIQSEKLYESNAWPYRLGILLEGKTGTGKSKIIEILAAKYNMPHYVVMLNSDKLTDSVLTNLAVTVPARSILAFDEFDKQYEAIKENTRVKITRGGILSALDSPPRLSYGTIVIMTANDITGFSDDFKSQLFRPGRINHYFQLNQTI